MSPTLHPTPESWRRFLEDLAAQASESERTSAIDATREDWEAFAPELRTYPESLTLNDILALPEQSYLHTLATCLCLRDRRLTATDAQAIAEASR